MSLFRSRNIFASPNQYSRIYLLEYLPGVAHSGVTANPNVFLKDYYQRSCARCLGSSKRIVSVNHNQLLGKKEPPASDMTKNINLVRLSKRMSELKLCSRREADKYIESGSVYVAGKRVDPILGIKVSTEEKDIQISRRGEVYHPTAWNNIRHDTVILNKPLGYLSSPRRSHSKNAPERYGQESYDLAVSLLNKRNYMSDYNKLDQKSQDRIHFDGPRNTLNGLAPAGRLDINSSGILLFTKSGIIANNLIHQSNIEKEYIVRVEALKRTKDDNNDRQQQTLDLDKSIDLSILFKDNNTLLPLIKPKKKVSGNEKQKEEDSPMRILPVVEAQWIQEQLLRIVITEGKKHQIRRMCRELLGLKVLSLTRTRIGKITLGSLPLGKWRFLSKDELEFILNS